MATPTLQTALVVSAHGRHCIVESADGQRHMCHPRGKKNLVVVGDQVDWTPPVAGQGDAGTIERVHARRNLFYRQDELRTKAFAANVDQVLIWLAAEPEFSPRLLTRALIAADAAGIPPLIVLNKADLRRSHAQGWQRLQPYRDMGYQTLSLSLIADEDDAPPIHMDTVHNEMAALRAALHGRITLVLGPSGSGKSSLINHLVPGVQVQTGAISQALQSGRHTTTSTHWYWVQRPQQHGAWLHTPSTAHMPHMPSAQSESHAPAALATLHDADATALIDSPGFQEFGLHHIAAADIAHHMPDLHAYSGQCRFYNCTHIHEPGCAVRAAIGDAMPADQALHTAANTIHSSHTAHTAPPTRIDPTRYAIYAELYAERSQRRYG